MVRFGLKEMSNSKTGAERVSVQDADSNRQQRERGKGRREVRQTQRKPPGSPSETAKQV